MLLLLLPRCEGIAGEIYSRTSEQGATAGVGKRENAWCSGEREAKRDRERERKRVEREM